MAALAPTRVAALDALRAVRGGALAGTAFEAAAAGLDARDRAWARELVYGTLRLRGRLDHRIAGAASRPLERIDPDTLDVLRLGAYQLTEMGGVPAYAAVSQSVELVRRHARWAAGFVNGVLRSLRHAGNESTFPSYEADPVACLTTWGSHPRWLVERWIARWGPDAARRLVEANNLAPQLYLRLLGDASATLDRIVSAGAVVEAVDGAPRAVRLVDAAAAGGLAAILEAAPVIVQDPAAGLVPTWAPAPPGGTVVDLAAAPGGKALALAFDPAPGDAPGLVVAADLSAARLARASENLARLRRVAPGAGRRPVAALAVADGRQPPFRRADLVLLDAPCTGTGTLRRHPDGRWRLQPRDLAALAALQATLLDAAAALVDDGGLLVYATCSLEPEENEEQVSSFLTRHRNFRIEAGPPLAAGLVRGDGLLEVLPQERGWDGAFAARLRREG